jgi:photosystem II stability/assembly factor-like uncharacterized protein
MAANSSPLTPLLLSLILAPLASAQADPSDLIAPLRWRGIGPANMMGRIASIDALNTDYRTVLVASASGGVFLSKNAGTTWKSIFDNYGAGSIGAAVFSQKEPQTIWVGTGESANRNSSGWGDGIYKSTNGGKSFEHMGLRDTQQIAEIAVHPQNPEIVWVAAIGHLWGYSGSRGLFKTTDGGKTWTKLSKGLPNNPKVGCTEIIVHPSKPDILFAGMYHRLRQPATMHSGGEDGGLFKSTDGGASWRKLTKGLPTGETGMIDVDIHLKDPQIVVANIEASGELPDRLDIPGPGVYRSTDGGESWTYLVRSSTRPFYHGQVAIDPSDPNRIFAVSRDFLATRDGGKTWTSKWWGGGGDDHDMWISPQDSGVFYNATDQGAYLSIDDGQTLTGFDNMAIGQYYAIGVDMRDPYWVLGGLQDNGIWIGPSNSREPRGILNMHNSWVGEGDGFHSQIDPTDWRTIYFVNHVGFAARLNVETREAAFITPTPETTTNFAAVADPNFPETPTRYTISPGEHWFFWGQRPERPRLPPQFRFNWSSPLVMSPKDPQRLYFGSNYLFQTNDRGDTWRIISPDLTTNDPELRNPSQQGGLTRNVTGGENYCTIITIAESPLDSQVLWVGTDDGNLQVTRDGGANWNNARTAISDVPKKTWVSRVETSKFDKGTCYVTFDNHRHDDMNPYVLVTNDFGKTFRNITSDLPSGSTYVIREDSHNPRLLFVGTEFGTFVSVDQGAHWTRMDNNLPTVAVHDLVIHPRDNDLIAATHGRSIWILDDITALQQLTPSVEASDLHLFNSRRATKWRKIQLGRKQPYSLFQGENPPPGGLIHFYAKSAGARIEIAIESPDGKRRWTKDLTSRAGINRVVWDLHFRSSDSSRQTMRNTLLRTVSYLEGLKLSGAHQKILQQAKSSLDRAQSDRRLNQARRLLVDTFAAYTNRPDFFGPKIGRVSAPAGTYRVTLNSGSTKRNGKITVREDPLGVK